MEDDLLNEILGMEEEKEDDDELIVLPETVSIGKGALDKAYAVCRLLKEVRGSSSEWYGLMLSTLDKPEVVRDFVFGKQESGAAHTEIDGEEVGKLTDLATKRGKDWIVNGWIHSHGGLATFFSGTDDTNMKTVLNSIYLNTRKSFKKSYNLIEGKKTLSYDKAKKEVLMKGALKTDPEICLALPSSKGLEKITQEQLKKIIKIKFKEPVLSGWSYSIVVNDAKDKKGHINYKEELPQKDQSRTWDKSANIIVVDEPIYEIKLDEDALKKEIAEKIKAPAPVVVYSGSKHWEHWSKKPILTARELFAKNYDRLFGKKEPEVVEEKEEEIPEPTEELVGRFIEELFTFYKSAGPTQFPPGEKRKAYETVVEAILGGINAHPSFSDWLEDRILKEDKEFRGDYEHALYQLAIDPAVVKTLLEYAKNDNDFAKLVGTFKKNNFRRKMALEEYEDSQKSKYEKEESETKEEKPKTNQDMWDQINGMLD